MPTLALRVREANAVSTAGQLFRVTGEAEPDAERGDLTEDLSAKARRRSATIKPDREHPSGRFPMPDRKHAKLALEFLDRAKGLSDSEKDEIRARAHRILGTEKTKESAVRPRTETLTFHPRFVENASSYDPETRTAQVIIIESGLGNSRDKHYYGPDTIASAALEQVFEGAQAFADHPSLDEDVNRPERSVRDLFGYYFNTHVVEVARDDGTRVPALAASLKVQEGADWAIGLIKEAIDYSKRFPNKTYVGISINADGDVSPATVDGQQVNYVHRITEAFSADMVTKPARGGKFLALVESASGARHVIKGDAVDKKLIESAARLRAQIESGEIDKDDLVRTLSLIESEAMEEAKVKEGGAEGKSGTEPDADDAGGEPDGDEDDKARESVKESIRESDVQKRYPTIFAAALKEAQAAVKGDVDALRAQVAEMSTRQQMRESLDLAKRKLNESKLPAAAAALLIDSLVGKDEAEMDRLIEAQVNYLKLLGVNDKPHAGNSEKSLSLRESDASANNSLIFAGMGGK